MKILVDADACPVKETIVRTKKDNERFEAAFTRLLDSEDGNG